MFPHKSLQHPKTSPGHQILIVDDYTDIREAVAFFLESHGFEVAPSSGVLDAYRRLREGFRPCVVLLDLHMPELDGWAFLDRMRDQPHLTDVPVIVISGDVNQRARARQRECEFVAKPVMPDALVGLIARHCRRHRL